MTALTQKKAKFVWSENCEKNLQLIEKYSYLHLGIGLTGGYGRVCYVL